MPKFLKKLINLIKSCHHIRFCTLILFCRTRAYLMSLNEGSCYVIRFKTIDARGFFFLSFPPSYDGVYFQNYHWSSFKFHVLNLHHTSKPMTLSTKNRLMVCVLGNRAGKRKCITVYGGNSYDILISLDCSEHNDIIRHILST